MTLREGRSGKLVHVIFAKLGPFLLAVGIVGVAGCVPVVGAQQIAGAEVVDRLPNTPEPRMNWVSAGETEQSTSSTSSAQVPAADASQRPMTPEERRQAAEAELQKELHQRIGGVVPNFNAVLDGNNTPLSPGQKMRASFRSAIDPYQFALAFITSGYGQATDSHSSIDPDGFRHGYGQGWIGFSKRYAANYADQFDGTILGNGVFPVLLHQDARYFRMGKGPIKKRLLYSLMTTVVCKGDNGKWQPNVSNVLGNLASGGISNLYYPAAERGAVLTVEQGITVTAEGSIGALLIEFYPDIRRHVHGKKRPADPTLAAPAAQP